MSNAAADVVELDVAQPVWPRCYTVAPLVVVGTRDEDGAADLAPKHMATPLGWENYFGFVCSPSHGTYQNIARSGVFTVSYPRPSQVVLASLAASPREHAGDKPILQALETFPAKRVDGVFASGGYLYFECEHQRTVDGFGPNSFVTGRIVAAYADRRALRDDDEDDQELIHDLPLLAFLAPNRFARIDASNGFPFPVGMQK